MKMKNFSKISFIVLIGLIHLIQTISSEHCIQCLNPFNRKEFKIVECPKPSTTNKRQTPTDTTPDNMFSVTFNCLANNQTLCKKVEDIFITAGRFITATLNLKQTVTVNATFLNFCDPSVSMSIPIANCNDPSRVVLGAAGPAMLNQFTDPTDNKVRLYPQALYKQLSANQNKQYNDFDIMAIFNSEMDYWFEGDPLPMGDRQADMLLVVTHELVHGLGFTTAWDDHLGLQALTPVPGLIDSEFRFVELIFDKFIILSDGDTPLTSKTDEINQFKVDLQTVQSDAQLISLFQSSPQFPTAQDLFSKATTKDSMYFKTDDNDELILETSLKPFQPSSSIGHSDFEANWNTSDFLMVFKSPRYTLGQMMFNAGSTNSTGPIGPKVRKVLKTIGYEVKDNYVPPVTLQSSNVPPPPGENPFPTTEGTTTRTSNSSSLSSLISLNLLSTLICILFVYIVCF